MTNPLDYTIQDPDAMRYALMANDSAGMRKGGAVKMADGGWVQNAYRSIVPAQIRTFGETLMGDRTPITEQNFTESELNQMRQAIANSRTARQKENIDTYNKMKEQEFLTGKKSGILEPSTKLDQTVDYQHYGTDGKSVRSDLDITPNAAVRNTLGRFAYHKNPQGDLIATDYYKFKDDLPRETRPTAEYEGMSTPEKLWTLAKDSAHIGGLESLPSRTGSAFIGADGRPVNVNLGPAPFATGGAVRGYEEGGPIWDDSGKMVLPAPFQYDMAGRYDVLPLKERDPVMRGSVFATPEQDKVDFAMPGMIASPVNAWNRGLTDPNILDANEVAMNIMGGGLGLSHAAPAPSGALGMAVKTKGGNWLSGSVEKALEPLYKIPAHRDEALMLGGEWERRANEPDMQGLMAKNETVNNWIDTKLAKYIKNEMGTPEDPIRALADKGKLHINSEELPYPVGVLGDIRPGGIVGELRTASGFPVESVSITPEGRSWEASADMSILPSSVDKVFPTLREPWMEKADPNSKFYAPQPMPFRDLGFDHLIDELHNATGGDANLPQQLRIDPAKLERMSMPEAVSRVADINKWRFEQAGKVAVENVAKLPEAMPSTDPKFTWRNLNNPEDAALSKGAHEAVGKDMGICIGGSSYVERAAKGEADHFSLFDDKGHPHIAIESRPTDIGRSFGSADEGLRQRIISQTNEKLGVTGIKDLEKTKSGEARYFKTLDDLYRAELGDNAPPPNIYQIKGKANETTVNPKYQQQLKEFLNSRPWGEVKETGGLIDTSLPTALSTKIAQMRLPIHIDRIDTVINNLQKKLPRFITENDLKAALVPEGYARGGRVTFTGDIDAMKYELAKAK